MKNIFQLIVSIVFAFGIMTAQTYDICTMQDIAPGVQTQIVNTTQPVVFIFVDFKDGRVAYGNAPTVDADTAYPGLNIDAVGSMGYTDPRTTRRKKIRKYVYEDYWNMVFSQNQYLGANVHPDYSTHDGYVQPYAEDKDQKPYNLKVYGSVRDYWNEVSYGNLQIQAYPTHSGGSDMYHTGIVNRIDVANGKNYIRWITLDDVKAKYSSQADGVVTLNPILKTLDKVRALHKLQTNDPNYIQFPVDSFLTLNNATTKIVIIYAGGMPDYQLGGWATGYPSQLCCIGEKLETATTSLLTNYSPSIILTSITGIAHELGHTFGFPHFVAGSYDIMHWGGFGDRRFYFCPPHVNPKYKITMGWIPDTNIIKVRSNTTNIPLPSISSTTPKVVLVTVYGDAGRNVSTDVKTNYNHSEYFIVEYRKREKFNQFVGGPDNTGFTGGALVWHYSKYTFFPISGLDLDHRLGLKVANYNNTFIKNNGDPSQLYYNDHSTLNSTTTPNSNSIENLTTGISLNGFAYSGNNLTFNVAYSIAPPTTYNYFYNDQSNMPSTLTGNVYMENVTNNAPLTINNGTVIDMAPNALFGIGGVLSCVANSTNGIVFRGVGYGSSCSQWNGISLLNGNCAINIQKTLISNAVVGLTLNGGISSPQAILTNNVFSNCVTALKLWSNNNADVPFPVLDNTTFNRLQISLGNWKLSNGQSIIIPSSSSFVLSPDLSIPAPSVSVTLKMGSGSNITVNGIMSAIGTTSKPVVFTSATGTTYGSWGSIYFDGSSASGSILQNCTIQYGYWIECNNGANATIDHCTIQKNGYGILCSNASPVISNNQILSNAVCGILVSMNGNPRIEKNTITSSELYRASGIRFYGGSGYIDSNTISGFYYGLSIETGSYVGGWSGTNYNYTPVPNNVLKGNNCGIGLTDHAYSFMGFYDSNTLSTHGGNNWIENNAMTDLGSYSGSVLHGEGNWYGNDFTPTTQKTADAYLFWTALNTNPWGGQQAQIANTSINAPSLEKSTSAAFSNIQANQNKDDEDKLIDEAISDHMGKLYGKAQIKYKQLLSSKKYSQSALVLLSHLSMESDDKNMQTYFEDLKTNAVSNKVDKSNIPLITNLLANIHGRQGDYSKAIAFYDEVINKYPKTQEERNARVQKIYYMLKGFNDKTGAKQQLGELISLYADGGDDIEMIKDLVNYSVLTSINTSQSLLNKSSEESTKDKKVITEYSLSTNYPNPFNPSTTINYQLPAVGHVTLKVYDVLGREIACLVDGTKEAGYHSATFNGSGFSSGIYFVRFTAKPADGSTLFTKTMKILMTK